MLDVLFGESAAGAMMQAMGRTSASDGPLAILFLHGEGDDEIPEEERRRLEEAYQERQRKAWANAVPLTGSREDIFCFPLAFSEGPIREEGIGEGREQVLRTLYATFPGSEGEADAVIARARESLRVLLERVDRGESLRVWSSRNPDEACGLCWLLEQLRPLGLDRIDLTVVLLPVLVERPGGTMVGWTGWGEVDPSDFGRLSGNARPLTLPVLRALTHRWRELMVENAPLRAELNGQLVSAPATLYDWQIRRELEDMGDEPFMEAMVIGNVLSRYQLGIGDSWVHRRIEKFVQAGELEALTVADEGNPVYHRKLRRVARILT